MIVSNLLHVNTNQEFYLQWYVVLQIRAKFLMTQSRYDPQPPPVAPPPVVLRNGNGFDHLFLQKGEDDVDCIPRNNFLLSVECLSGCCTPLSSCCTSIFLCCKLFINFLFTSVKTSSIDILAWETFS